MILRYFHNLVPAAKVALACGFVFSFWQCTKEPSPALSPDQALDSFVLADQDLSIELVASEPLVQDPVAISFDEEGHLWVVEMLGFMQDIDGSGELDRIGRVSVLFDDDQDGRMDRSTVFLDSLVLPRAIAVVQGGALIAENIPLWYAEDTDGDFKADRKILIDSTYGGLGMPEHSANGLWRGIDNWYYNAKSEYRYRKTSKGWIREQTEFRGQWGISHDDAGRLFYNYNWSQLHADLVPPNALMGNPNHSPTSGIDHGLTLNRKIYPVRSNTAVNRGYIPGTLDSLDRLLEFASACGPLVYRGNALPEAFYGDAFVCEPTANLIKRNKLDESGFMISANEAYDRQEFLASTDERFRPISLSSGPDGSLYVVDMYKGIIQHGPYMTPYLREETLKRGLDKPIHMGRIWRISSGESALGTGKFGNTGPMTLVSKLNDPNGWTRDTAQRLLVEKGDLSLAPAVVKLLDEDNFKGQIHALWTLEGLGYTEPKPFLKALRSGHPKVGSTALRILQEKFFEHKDVRSEISRFITEKFDAADPAMQMQMIFASQLIPESDALPVVAKFLTKLGELPVARDVALSSLKDREFGMLAYLISLPEWKTYGQHKEITLELLSTAIANSGKEQEASALLALLEDSSGNTSLWVKTSVCNGLVNRRRPVDASAISLSRRPELFSPAARPEAPIQAQLTDLKKMFSWPGKPEEPVKMSETATRADRNILALGRQQYINLCANCHGTQGEGMARFAPPLKDSEWVTGKEEHLAVILLHGMEGPVSVNGKKYDIPDILPQMPSFSTLQNEDIAAIATYIRNTWGHSEAPIGSRTIGKIRFRTQGKITPWKAEELESYNFNTDL